MTTAIYARPILRASLRGGVRDLYQEVTDRILDLLESGTVPWRHPIKRPAGGDGIPKNLDSGRNYRGVNVFLLALTSWAKGYESAYWLTFKQARKQGGHVKKGEKSSLVVFWKMVEKRDKITKEEITIPVLRHYNVFNAAQCENIQPPDAYEPDPNAEPFIPLDAAERIVAGYDGGPKIEISGGAACYQPTVDTVRIAKPSQFDTRENYYATLFHELAHSSGHSSRLDRGLDTVLAPFGSPDYSKEELVAEMGAAFLSAAAGISPPTIEQSAAYIDNWRKKLQGDKKLIITAAGAGQKAADWILGVRPNSVGPS